MEKHCNHPSHYGTDSKDNPIKWRNVPKGQNGYCPKCNLLVVYAGLKIQQPKGKFIAVRNKGHTIHPDDKQKLEVNT